jgi:hypothetical protein
MITTALAALALIAPTDTPIEPLESSVVEFFLASPDGTEICAQIGEMSDLVDVFGVALDQDVSLIFDMAVTYFQRSAEEGWGETAAMTLEAEDYFRSWAYDCGGRIEPVGA